MCDQGDYWGSWRACACKRRKGSAVLDAGKQWLHKDAKGELAAEPPERVSEATVRRPSSEVFDGVRVWVPGGGLSELSPSPYTQ